MTENKVPDGILPSRALIAVADRHFEASLRRLDAILQEIEAGRFGPEKDLTAASQAVRKAVEGALSERARFDRLAGGSGNVPDPALNLDAARDEIGRRLARLRAAGDGGDVSG